MDFLGRYPGQPTNRLGILPGSFNPPTRAHLALAVAALVDLDEVVLVLPRAFPHKDYVGANFGQRVEMLRAVTDRHPRLAAAASVGGLFLEIAQECRVACGPSLQLTFVCGRDAAERIVNWDYGNPNAINRMLETFDLMVACRNGDYAAPPRLRKYIRPLSLPTALSAVSASDVRRRIREGAAWEHLVPDAIVPMVRDIYRPLE